MAELSDRTLKTIQRIIEERNDARDACRQFVHAVDTGDMAELHNALIAARLVAGKERGAA